MNQWHRLWLCTGALALASSSAHAHTSKVCWRVEDDGSVTMFAGTYHDAPGLFGGVIVDGTEYAFTDSTPVLPDGVTRCQADCAPSPPIVKWQIASVTLPSGLHLVETTDTSEHETPWPGCYPMHFGTGAPIPTTLYYTGGTSTEQGVAVTVGTIMDPVVLGALVVFTLDGGESCTAFADWNGIASCAITPMRPGGDYPLTATYLGDGTIQPSSKTISFTVIGEPPPPPPPAATSLEYTGDTRLANAKPAQLSGVLRDAALAPLSGRTVQLTLGAGAAAQSCSGVTDASGTASCSIDAVDQPLDAAAAVAVSASFAGDASYLPSSAGAEASLQHMTGEAYAIAGNVRFWLSQLTVPRTPDTGPARAAHASATAAPCSAALSGKVYGVELLGAQQLCASVITDPTLGTSTATASIGRVTIGSGGLLPPIRINEITASSQSSCGGASGHVSIGSLAIGSLTIPIGALPPNTSIGLPFGGKITFNEQVAADDAEHGMTVHGVHVVMPPVHGFGGLDFVLASATSAIHDCRPGAAGFVPFLGDGGDGAAPADADAEEADALDPEGGCQSTRPGGALGLGLAGVALLGARRRRRRS